MIEDTNQDIKPNLTNEELQAKLEEIIHKPLDYKGGHPNMTSDESKARLRELILYVAEQCKDKPDFNLGSLSDILYLIDMAAYRQTGKSLTGTTYIKREDWNNERASKE